MLAEVRALTGINKTGASVTAAHVVEACEASTAFPTCLSCEFVPVISDMSFVMQPNVQQTVAGVILLPAYHGSAEHRQDA